MAATDHAAPGPVAGDACNMTAPYNSNQGCPDVSLDLFLAFVAQYWYIWGGVFIVLGLFLSLFGNAFVAAVIFIAGAIAGWMFLSWLVFFIIEQAHGDPSEAVAWVVLVSCGLVGLLLGWVLTKCRKLAIALVGAGGGVALGFMLTTVTLISSGAGYYCIIIGCALAAAILTWFLEDYVIMLATALLGSYIFIRGISFYAGGFPNEFDIKHYIQAGIERGDFPASFYGYLGGIAAMFILTLIFQCCRHKSIKEKAEAARRAKDKRTANLERFGSDI